MGYIAVKTGRRGRRPLQKHVVGVHLCVRPKWIFVGADSISARMNYGENLGICRVNHIVKATQHNSKLQPLRFVFPSETLKILDDISDIAFVF